MSGGFKRKCASQQLHEEWSVLENEAAKLSSKVPSAVQEKLLALCNKTRAKNYHKKSPNFCSGCCQKAVELYPTLFKEKRSKVRITSAKDGSLIYQRRRSSLDSVSPASSYGPQPDSKMSVGPGKRSGSDLSISPVKRRRSHLKIGHEVDGFCWQCHMEAPSQPSCRLCPRVFHKTCLGKENPDTDWVCPECQAVMKAECIDTRSRAMSMISSSTLCVLLKYAITRMQQTECDDFCRPVDISYFTNYKDYITNPMDLSLMEKNISKRVYGSTEAFYADCKWIYHNSFVFNGSDHTLTATAKSLLKICKHEMDEIEICPDCYLKSSSQTTSDWFCEPCSKPHPLVWAKMKGYPHWPAKVLRQVNNMVDVRFFGEHDRSWVPLNSTYQLSKEPLVQIKQRKAGYEKSMKELDLHIKKLKERFGSFQYAPPNTLYSIDDQLQQTTYKHKYKRRSHSPKTTPRKSPAKESPTKSLLSQFKTKPASILVSPLKINAESAATKTASAVKLKYNSIIFTRRAAAAAARGSPEKTSNQGDDPTQSDNDEAENNTSSLETGEVKSSPEKPSSEIACESQSKETVAETPKMVPEMEERETVDNSDSQPQPDGQSESAKFADSEDFEKEDPTEGIGDKEVTEDSCDKSTGDKSMICDELSCDVAPRSPTSSAMSSPLELHVSDIAAAYSPSKPKTKYKEVLKRIEEKIKMAEEEETEMDIPNEEEGSNDKTAGCSVSSDNKELKSDGCQTQKSFVSTDKADGSSEPSDKADGAEESIDKTGKDTSSIDTGDEADGGSVSTDKVGRGGESADLTRSTGVSDLLHSCGSRDRDFLVNLMQSCREKLGLDPEKKDGDDDDDDMMTTSDDSSEDDDDDNSDSSLSSAGEAMSSDDDAKRSSEDIRHKKPRIDFRKLKALKARKIDDVEKEMLRLTSHNELLERKLAKWETRRKHALAKRNALRRKLARTTSNQTPSPQPETGTVIGDVILVPDTPSDTVTPSDDRVISDKSPDDKESVTSDKTAEENIDASNGCKYPPSNPITVDMRGFDISQYTSKAVKRHFQLELDRVRWVHSQEIQELKQNTEVALAEMRFSLEQVHEQATEKLKQKLEKEKTKAIEETKKKQWCAKCGKEAIFYCCWNTSYCDYPCQQAHWPDHMPNCAQPSNDDNADKQQPVLDKPGAATTSSDKTLKSSTSSAQDKVTVSQDKGIGKAAQEAARVMLSAAKQKININELNVPRHLMGSPIQQGSPIPQMIGPSGAVAMVPPMQPFNQQVGMNQRIPMTFTPTPQHFVHPTFQTIGNSQQVLGGVASPAGARPGLILGGVAPPATNTRPGVMQQGQRLMYSVVRPNNPIPHQNPVLIAPQRPINIVPAAFPPKTA